MSSTGAREAVEAAYRTEARWVLASLVRVLGSFELAEEALHEAFLAAAEQWPREGVPARHVAWLVSAGRFKLIDRLRKHGRLAQALPALDERGGAPSEPDQLPDDELRMIFLCCHPALAPDARIALTLREVAGLTTEAIARAFLVRTPTMAQRIVRAKASLRAARVPYELPTRAELPERLEAVLRVLYLIFNEGYSATSGASFLRTELCDEAIRLARVLSGLLAPPDDGEALGLLALMLFHDARKASRTDAEGEPVLLEAQDRRDWSERTAEAREVLARAFASGRVGSYALQAAIVEVHARAASVEQTDWARIVGLYELLARVDPSPVISLNRAVALSRRDGLEAGLVAIDEVMSGGRLEAYPLAHAARADLLRRLGRGREARAAYSKALALTRQPAEQRFLEARLAALG